MLPTMNDKMRESFAQKERKFKTIKSPLKKTKYCNKLIIIYVQNNNNIIK